MDKAGKINWAIILIIVGALIGIIAVSLIINLFGESRYDGFAKCLTEKGFKLYGAYWCGNCEKQKLAFGDSFKYINYVECDENGENGNPGECAADGITGYPMWVINGEKRLIGFQSLDALSGVSGCELTDN